MNNYKRNSEPWLQLVHKELKGKAMGELAFGLDSELTIDPVKAYLYDENEKGIIGSLPKSTFLQFIRIYSHKENQIILNCLAQGASGLYLELADDFDLNDLPNLLADVFPEMISLFIDIKKCSFSVDKIGSCLEKINSHWTAITIIDKGSGIVIDLSAQEIVEPITNGVLDVLNTGASILNITPSQSFFTNIAALRALRVLFLNLELNPIPKILIMDSANNRDFNQSLIAYTTNSLSSILGGSDFICLLANSNDPQELRLLGNIPHLINLESGISEHYDAVQGSRNLSYMTTQIAQSVWSKLEKI